VDVQRNMLEGSGAIPAAAQITSELGQLLDSARACGAVVVHVQNDGTAGDPDEPGTPGWELFFPPTASEIVVRKDSQDAFESNPDLAERLRALGVDRVVIGGMQSEYCILDTSRGASRAGFSVVLPSGAHATYDGDESACEISAQIESTLEQDGVEVTEQVSFS